MQTPATSDGTTCTNGFYSGAAGVAFQPILAVKLADPSTASDSALAASSIGIIVGAVLLVVLAVVVAVWWRKRRGAGKPVTASSSARQVGLEMRGSPPPAARTAAGPAQPARFGAAGAEETNRLFQSSPGAAMTRPTAPKAAAGASDWVAYTDPTSGYPYW